MAVYRRNTARALLSTATTTIPAANSISTIHIRRQVERLGTNGEVTTHRLGLDISLRIFHPSNIPRTITTTGVGTELQETSSSNNTMHRIHTHYRISSNLPRRTRTMKNDHQRKDAVVPILPLGLIISV